MLFRTAKNSPTHRGNRQGVTIVPLDVRVNADCSIDIRAKDADYAAPGPDETLKF
jgi:arylsulfatase